MNYKAFALVLLLCASASLTASAQGRRGGQTRTPTGQPQQPTTVITPMAERAPAVTARESEVACGGFITMASTGSVIEVIGAQDERERRLFAEGRLQIEGRRVRIVEKRP